MWFGVRYISFIQGAIFLSHYLNLWTENRSASMNKSFIKMYKLSVPRILGILVIDRNSWYLPKFVGKLITECIFYIKDSKVSKYKQPLSPTQKNLKIYREEEEHLKRNSTTGELRMLITNEINYGWTHKLVV